ncbi:hypothetical protein H5979_06340 [Faecalicoccus pleomorphus]|uniref:hypothetical protein n=1 Tax=Faecalicoccus pleomorphus TaxID=1323 RepID=UPI00195FC622|nr:hypothetical protein [Faecalicoccus pleomorphus]MBM6678304.1 hypothetical protein [Faecalicoccus pleomorphus]
MDTIYVFIVIIILSVSFSIIKRLIRSYRLQQLLFALQEKNTGLFQKLVNSKINLILFPKYNLEYLKLNGYILEKNSEMIEEQFKVLNQYVLSKEQRKDLLLKKLTYYTTTKSEKAMETLKMISDFKDTDFLSKAQEIYAKLNS